MKKTVLMLIVITSFASMFYPQVKNGNIAKAMEFLELLQNGEFAKAEGFFSDDMKAKLPAEELEKIWNSLPEKVGKLRKLGNAKISNVRDHEVVTILGEFEAVNLDIEISFDNERRIGGFFMRPSTTATGETAESYENPAYARPELYEEDEVTIGSGKWSLPGSLTYPKAEGKYPAVIIVHGSGPGDRDGTHVNRANKPYKDLALGLSSNGVVVLRYEKRTKQYGVKLAADKRLTVKEEVVDDVLSALEFLQKDKRVDASKIFVLGHSLGGYLIPRINNRTKEIAGFISLAGATRHLEDAFLDQNRYFAMLDGEITDEEKGQLDELAKLVEEIKSLTSKDLESSKMYIGAYAAYWLDLKKYDPTKEAKSIKIPFLILQGERDYQVTMDDFRNWKASLGGRKNVSFKSYPALNHIFMAGEGTPGPADYSEPAHVSEQVIKDIREWIDAVKST